MSTSSSTLLLSRTAVATLAAPGDYLSCTRAAFVDLANERYSLPRVGHVPGNDGAFHIKSAVRRGASSLAAIKVNGNFPNNTATTGLPTIQGFIALLDANNGAMLALMDSIEITARRTAAATAVAAERLAPAASRTLGIIGCGTQAHYHLEALLDVAPIEAVRFCDPRDDAAAAFGRHAAGLGLSANRVPDASAAARGAGIVVTVTTSTRPVLGLSDIDPGTLVAGVGADNPAKHELAPDLLRGSRVVVDLLTQATVLGDLHHAIVAGAMSASDIHGELAALVCGRITGRARDDEIFVFDSTGVALQDLAAAEMIYERARASGVGQAISLSV